MWIFIHSINGHQTNKQTTNVTAKWYVIVFIVDFVNRSILFVRSFVCLFAYIYVCLCLSDCLSSRLNLCWRKCVVFYVQEFKLNFLYRIENLLTKFPRKRYGKKSAWMVKSNEYSTFISSNRKHMRTFCTRKTAYVNKCIVCELPL